MIELDTMLRFLTQVCYLCTFASLMIGLVMTVWRAVRSLDRANQCLALFHSWLCFIGLIGVNAIASRAPELLEIALGLAFLLPFSSVLVGVSVFSTHRPPGSGNS